MSDTPQNFYAEAPIEDFAAGVLARPDPNWPAGLTRLATDYLALRFERDRLSAENARLSARVEELETGIRRVVQNCRRAVVEGKRFPDDTDPGVLYVRCTKDFLAEAEAILSTPEEGGKG